MKLDGRKEGKGRPFYAGFATLGERPGHSPGGGADHMPLVRMLPIRDRGHLAMIPQ
jgi:hypothetical protein